MTHPSGRSDTLAEPARPRRRSSTGRRPPARTALPAPSSRPGRRTESFPGFRACGKRGGHGKGGDRRAGPPSAWCPVSGPCVWRSRGGAGLSPAPEPLSSCVRSQGLSRGSHCNAMSRLLPLLGSRTVRSLRPGPAAAPRPPSWCGCGRGLLALGVPGGPRLLGTHPKKEPMEALNTAQGARDFIYSLHSTERSCLLKELHRFESIAIAQGKRVGPPGKTSFLDPCRLPTLWPRAWDRPKGETFHLLSVPEAGRTRTRTGRARQLGPSLAGASLAMEFRSFSLKCRLTLGIVFWFVPCASSLQPSIPYAIGVFLKHAPVQVACPACSKKVLRTGQARKNFLEGAWMSPPPKGCNSSR